MELRAEKLRQEIRFETARADLAEIEAEQQEDKDRDRKAKNGYTRQLNIFGDISEGNVDVWVDILMHWEKRDPAEPIYIMINSDGGSINDGFVLFDTIMRLRRKGHHVVTHGTGMVASMAAVLMQAGDERILDKNATFMIHEASAGISGGTRARKNLEKYVTRLENRLVEILAERSNLSVAQIKRRITKDDFMLAEEALKFGFVDRVE